MGIVAAVLAAWAIVAVPLRFLIGACIPHQSPRQRQPGELSDGVGGFDHAHRNPSNPDQHHA